MVTIEALNTKPKGVHRQMVHHLRKDDNGCLYVPDAPNIGITRQTLYERLSNSSQRHPNMLGFLFEVSRLQVTFCLTLVQ